MMKRLFKKKVVGGGKEETLAAASMPVAHRSAGSSEKEGERRRSEFNRVVVCAFCLSRCVDRYLYTTSRVPLCVEGMGGVRVCVACSKAGGGDRRRLLFRTTRVIVFL